MTRRDKLITILTVSSIPPSPPPAESDLERLTAENQLLQEQIAKLTDVAARAQADLLNFKERMKREGNELRTFAIAPLLLGLLPIRDDLVRMVEHSSNDGSAQILAKIDALLKTFGVESMESAGKMVNPDYHQIVHAGPGEKDMVIVAHEEGFLLHGKVLRPAKVMAGDGSAAA